MHDQGIHYHDHMKLLQALDIYIEIISLIGYILQLTVYHYIVLF